MRVDLLTPSGERHKMWWHPQWPAPEPRQIVRVEGLQYVVDQVVLVPGDKSSVDARVELVLR